MSSSKSGANYSHSRYVEVSYNTSINEAINLTIDEGSYCCCTFDTYSNKSLGSGIKIYFWYVKRLIFMFMFLFIFSIPTIILCYKSTGVVQQDNSFYYFLFTTTIGRLSYDSTAEKSLAVDLWGLKLNGKTISTIISVLDIFTSLIFFSFALEMMRRMKKLAITLDKSRYSVTDYAVEVSNIPSDTTKIQLMSFFDQLYHPTNKNDRFQMENGLMTVRSAPKKIRVSPEAIDPANSCVIEVSLLERSYGEKLRYFHPYKSLITNIELNRRKIQMYISEHHKNYSEYFNSIRNLSKFLVKRDKVIKNRLKVSSSDVSGAIIVFSSELSKYLCLIEFDHYDSFKYKLCCSYPQHLLFLGKYRLKVREAMHPTDYNWENFSVNKLSYCCRQTLTFAVTLIVLLISIFLCSYIQLIQNMNNSVLPTNDFCDVQYPNFTDPIYRSDPFDYMVGDEVQHGICREKYHGKGHSDSYNINFMKLISSDYDNWFYISYNSTRSDFDDNNPCLSPCTSPSTFDTFTCDLEDDCIPSSVKQCKYHVSSILGCYCNKKYIDNLSKAGIISLFKEFSDDKICMDFGISYALFTVVSFFAVVIVLIFNLLLYYLFNYMGDFERHKSLSDQTNLKIVKLFFGYLLSTAFIILITTSSGFLGRYKSKFLSQIGLFAGVHTDFTPQWYRDVGASIIFTLLLGLVTHNLYFLIYRIVIYPCKMSRLISYPIKSEIIEGYTSLVFMIDTSVPYILSIVFVTMIYAGGLPILYLTCLLTLTFQYLVDGYVIHHCKKPPVFKSSVMSFFTYAMPYSVLLHLAFTGWMAGYKDLYYNSEDVDFFLDLDKLRKADFLSIWERATRLNCFIYVMAFLFLIALIIIYYLFTFIVGLFKRTNNLPFFDLPDMDEIELSDSFILQKGLSKEEMEDGNILVRKSIGNNKYTYHIASYVSDVHSGTATYNEILAFLNNRIYVDLPTRDELLFKKLVKISDYLKRIDYSSYDKELIPKYQYVEKLTSDFNYFYSDQ